MKKIATLFLVLLCLPAFPQASYWFTQWEKKPDAAQAQAFFMLPGTNVFFTYTNNRVVINATGGGGGPTVGLTTNFAVIFGDWKTNTLFFSNGLLIAINAIPAHAPSIILPGGGYLTQPGGSTLLLP